MRLLLGSQTARRERASRPLRSRTVVRRNSIGEFMPTRKPDTGARTTDCHMLEAQMSALLSALAALKRGDSSVRLPREWTGLGGKVAETFNDVVELNERTAEELMRIRKTVGKQGKLRQRASIGDVRG